MPTISKGDILLIEDSNKSIDIVERLFSLLRLSDVFDFDCCHTHPLLTIPIGSRIRIDFNQEFVELIG